MRHALRLMLWLVPLSPAALGAQPPATPIGVWHTVDDATGRPRAVIEVIERNDVVVAIIRGSLVPGEPPRVCAKCPGDRRDQPLVGLEMIRNVRRDGATWGGGELLDPDNGKTYRVKLTPSADGRTLDVRAYVGLPAFGRTQVWTRAP